MLRKTLTASLLFALAALLSGCTAPEPTGAPHGEPLVTPPVVSGGGPVITHVRSREHFLTIHASGNGPRFSVATAGGRLLDASLTQQDLAARYPSLAQTYERAIVEGGPAPLISIETLLGR